MMAQAGLMRSQPQLMGEALKHATYLNNKLLADEDPKNALAKIPVFGSVAWVNVPKEDRTKFDYKARLGVWVGVPSHHGRRSNNIYMLDTGKIAVSRHVEIWDGVMLSQLRQSEFNGKLPHLTIYDSPEEGDNIPVLVSFKKSGDRSVREYDIGEDGKSGEGKVEQKEDVKDHGGRLLRAKMVAYEFKNGYYVIKKAGDLRKRERDKWKIITESEYSKLMLEKEELEAKRRKIQGITEPASTIENTPVEKWKPGDQAKNAGGENEVGEIAVSIPLDSRDDDFDVIDKINQVLDGKTGRREALSSWNVDREGESRESDEDWERRSKVNRLVSTFESKSFKAVKKKMKKKGTNEKENFPRTVAEAMTRPDWELWKEAIKKEMISIVKMGTFRDLQSKKDWKGKEL